MLLIVMFVELGSCCVDKSGCVLSSLIYSAFLALFFMDSIQI